MQMIKIDFFCSPIKNRNRNRDRARESECAETEMLGSSAVQTMHSIIIHKIHMAAHILNFSDLLEFYVDTIKISHTHTYIIYILYI